MSARHLISSSLLLCCWLTCIANSAQNTQMQVTADLASSSIRIKLTDPIEHQRLSTIVQTQSPQSLAGTLRAVVSETENIPKDQPSVAGAFEFDKQEIIFRAKYPLTAGVRYWIIATLDKGGTPIMASARIEPQQLPPSTRVTAIYPTSEKLPENLLKFYVHFSAPMSFGNAYTHIHLIGAKGERLSQPFLEVAEELWDPTGKRLTLLLDPARVKRGLVPREEEGPVLNAGTRYKLIIDSTWEDSQGTPLVDKAVKEFTVVNSDFTSPDPANWHVEAPKAQSRNALTVRFIEPLDHAIVARCIQVLDSSGRSIEGKVTLQERETIWRFEPDQVWQDQQYALQISDIIEDLAGNSIARPFEVDRFDKIELPVVKNLKLDFKPTSD